MGEIDRIRALLLNPSSNSAILKYRKIPKFTYPEFFSLCTICHQMCNFWIKVFSNNSTHVMNQCHQSDLKRKCKHWLYNLNKILNYVYNSFSIYWILSIYKVHMWIFIKINFMSKKLKVHLPYWHRKNYTEIS